MSEVRVETVTVPGWHDEPWAVHVRSAPVRDGDAPVVWVHGVPTSGRDWVPFLERAGGFAPDLPGFGRSSKRGDGDFTLSGYGRFLGPLTDALGLDRIRLVVHDWGGAALQWAAANPHRVEKLVVIDAVPLLASYRWHRIARIWRTRGLGEVAMGLSGGPVLRRVLPGDLGAQAADVLDQGTQRAILRLYRSADPPLLGAAGAAQGALEDVPTLVVWGGRDPYIPAAYAEEIASALGGAEVVVRPECGHWPWVDDPSVIDLVTSWLDDKRPQNVR